MKRTRYIVDIYEYESIEEFKVHELKKREQGFSVVKEGFDNKVYTVHYQKESQVPPLLYKRKLYLKI